MATSIPITKSGSYAGQSYGSVNIQTEDAVDFERCTFSGPVTGRTGCRVTFRNCTFPKNPGVQAICLWLVNSFTLENCLLDQNAGVVISIIGDGAGLCRYNLFTNISGATGPATKNKTSGFQIDQSHSANIEIAWNVSINQRGIFAGEDQFSLMQSGGTPGHPALIHDNLVDGGYQYPAGSAEHYSGSGVMCYDPGPSTGLTSGGYSHVFSNVIIAHEHKGISLAGSHDVEIDHNNCVAEGNGDIQQVASAIDVFNWDDKTPVAHFGPFNVHDNQAWWMFGGKHFEYSFTPPTVSTNNTVVATTDAAQRAAYWHRVATAGITIGPLPAPTPATSLFDATKFSSASAGIKPVPLPAENLGAPTAIGYTKSGWARYANIDFGAGVKSVTINYGAPVDGGTIEVRLDSITGPVVATLPIQKTSGWYQYVARTGAATGSGVHDLYIVFPTSAANVHSFQFQ